MSIVISSSDTSLKKQYNWSELELSTKTLQENWKTFKTLVLKNSTTEVN